MKFFHLSDLHIGKHLFYYSLLEDQKYVFHQILEAAKEEQPDAVLLCGDIYDKTIPSAEAVSLFDWFLTELKETLPKALILIIAGNHDSGERLEFARELLEKEGVFIAGFQRDRLEPGEMAFHRLPETLAPFVGVDDQPRFALGIGQQHRAVPLQFQLGVVEHLKEQRFRAGRRDRVQRVAQRFWRHVEV